MRVPGWRGDTVHLCLLLHGYQGLCAAKVAVSDQSVVIVCVLNVAAASVPCLAKGISGGVG